MHPHRVAERVGLGLPDVLQKLLLADRLPRPEHEILQDPKFLAGQGEGETLGGDLPPLGIQREWPHHEGRIPGGKIPAQQGAHPGLQFLQGKGLGEVVVRPQVQSGHPVGQGAPGGQDEHPLLGFFPADCPQDIQPVHAGQVQIQNHQIVGLHQNALPGLQPVIAALHGVALQLQVLGNIVAQLALCLTLSACGSKAPSPEEVEAAIRDGSVTIEDALDKGWITQEWADSYQEERSVPAADKMAVNKVGAFETETLTGETYTGADLPDTAFLVFLDPEDPGAADFYTGLVDAVEDVRAAGADIVVCSKGDMDHELFQDAPFPVVAYNESMQEALAQNDEMASEIPCVGVWYVNGSLISAWTSQVEAEDLAASAPSFVAMTQEDDPSGEDGMAAVAMG